MQKRYFEDGEVIFHQGDRSDAAYLITSGQIEVIRPGRDGHPYSIAVLGRGDYLGEMGAIDDCPRSATAIARGPVRCMSVDQDEFMHMLLNRPGDSIDLLKLLFVRLRDANEKLARLDDAEA